MSLRDRFAAGVTVRPIPGINPGGCVIRPKTLWQRFFGEDISGADFAGMDFTRCQVSHLTFEGCIFDGATFTSAELLNVKFRHCRFLRTDWSGCLLSFSDFEHCQLTGSKFEGARLNSSGFSNCDLHAVDARYMHIEGGIADCDATAALFSPCTFAGTVLRTDFSHSDFRGARFRPLRKEGRELYFVANCIFIDVIVDEATNLAQAIGTKYDDGNTFRPVNALETQETF